MSSDNIYSSDNIATSVAPLFFMQSTDALNPLYLTIKLVGNSIQSNIFRICIVLSERCHSILTWKKEAKTMIGNFSRWVTGVDFNCCRWSAYRNKQSKSRETVRAFPTNFKFLIGCARSIETGNEWNPFIFAKLGPLSERGYPCTTLQVGLRQFLYLFCGVRL
jgi:hypothetical protein